MNTHIKSSPENGRKQGGRQGEGQRCGVSQPNKANSMSASFSLTSQASLGHNPRAASGGLKVSYEERTGGRGL